MSPDEKLELLGMALRAAGFQGALQVERDGGMTAVVAIKLDSDEKSRDGGLMPASAPTLDEALDVLIGYVRPWVEARIRELDEEAVRARADGARCGEAVAMLAKAGYGAPSPFACPCCGCPVFELGRCRECGLAGCETAADGKRGRCKVPATFRVGPLESAGETVSRPPQSAATSPADSRGVPLDLGTDYARISFQGTPLDSRGARHQCTRCGQPLNPEDKR